MQRYPSLRSNLIGGVIATVIYIVIAVLTGQSPRAAVGFGVLLGLVTFVVSFLVTRLVVASRGNSSGG